jgi:lycopene cyclase domain-containing protein
MTYTVAAVLGVAGAVLLDAFVLRTRLVTRKAFWTAYAIVLLFQLVVNGLLTGLKIVRYDPSAIIGPRLAYAPVEDLLFGFALALTTLSLWVWLGRAAPTRPRAHRSARPSRGGQG